MFVRTVLGDISPDMLGFTHGHDHLFVFRASYTAFPERVLLDDYEMTKREVARYRERGGGAVVDVTPFGAGRHPEFLEKLSRETGVAVIAATGLHKAAFYREGFWSFTASSAELADLFSGEIERGMYAFDPEDPFSRRSTVRAGIIKIATDERGFTDYERRMFDAAIAAHRTTGAPILTHTELSQWGMAQADYLIDRGVSPHRIVIGHMDRRIDIGRNLELAGLGVFLAYDTIARFKYHSDEEEAGLIEALVKGGFGDRILLGMDSTKERFLSYGGTFGLDYILLSFSDLLRKRGIAEEQFHAMLVDNPHAALTIAAPLNAEVT